MKIEASVDAHLDNAAVFAHLNEIAIAKAKKEGKPKPKKHLLEKPKNDYEYVINKANDYFSTAISLGNLPEYERYPEGHIKDLMTRLKKYDLTKSEMLMILNLKPTELDLLDVIIEEIDERHPNQDDQEKILEIISSALGTQENGTAELNGHKEEDGKDDMLNDGDS